MFWQQNAKCRDEDPELFFPVSDTGPGAAQAAQAKAVCNGCSVRGQCLEHAQNAGITDGVFGGQTAAERRNSRATARRP